ncbi:MAG: hypothetical protein OXF98_03240, partial [Rhodospirillaceae bacterium]|nr:hypothetical protein [Rhodospirillaceae bacterium]
MITRARSETFRELVERYRDRVNARLDQTLAIGTGVPRQLTEAMRYAVLGPGKRIRPLLSYATGELLELEPQR